MFTSISPFVGVQELCSRVLLRLLVFRSISSFVGVQELCSRVLVRLLVFRSCVHEY